MATDSVVKSIQDIMRQDVGVDGDAQRISQMGWMIFLKLFDASDRELELIRDDYTSPIPEDLRWRNWAADEEGVTGDDLLQFIDETLFPALSDLEVDEDNRRGLIVRSVFEDSYNYMKSGTLLRKVINKLEEIDFTSQEERHVFNDVYEKILRDLQSAGNAAEYYTPRPVTRFMAEQVDPELGETVLDPACGSGNFLYLALKGLKDFENRVGLEAEALGLERHLPEVGVANMRGIEISPYAAELARVTLWIGEIQWMLEHGFSLDKRPKLLSGIRRSSATNEFCESSVTMWWLRSVRFTRIASPTAQIS